MVAVLPTSAVAVIVLDLEWAEFFVVVLACVIPAAYATVLSYSVGEALSRPMVADIAAALPDDFPFERHGLPVSKRLRVGLPAYTAATGVLVAAAVGGREGSAQLALAVLVSLVVGLALSHELAMLLSRGITEPIHDVRRALERVREGDLTARVPVVTSDELGELAHDFNLMARGLEEREEMRTAFGTYMDKEVAALILSGQFPQEGVEVDVSIMFCDVRGFTSYAESAEATEVIATLNRLFETMVPIVDRHGGHVDKFIGDGLLAVFGAPETYPDHADRAVRAACEIAAAVNAGDTGLTVGVGVNSGRVVAGSIGGGGRLNFSVIGDAVNVAARVEGATRQTGDDVLITAATRDLMLGTPELVSRGTIPLKGKAEPLEVFAPLANRQRRGAGESPASLRLLRAVEAVQDQEEHHDPYDGQRHTDDGADSRGAAAGGPCSGQARKEQPDDRAQQCHASQLRGQDPVLGPLVVQEVRRQREADRPCREEDYQGEESLDRRAVRGTFYVSHRTLPRLRWVGPRRADPRVSAWRTCYVDNGRLCAAGWRTSTHWGAASCPAVWATGRSTT